MPGFEFRDGAWLLLLVPLAFAAAWYFFGKLHHRESALAISSEEIVTREPSLRAMLYPWLPVLRFLSIFFLILALARPGRGISYTSVKNQGIDIMIALDVSDSMMGEDFQPKNRLEVAKRVIRDFVAKRPTDRIGMVVFSGDAYLQCPLTAEHDIIGDILDDIDFDTVGEEGTAIGEALALSASRMLDSTAKSRIILLLTDGVNNRGSIDPETASKMCAELGIKVYSVGIGKEGPVPYSSGKGIFRYKTYRQDQFDPEAIRKISETTGGKFYRALTSGILWENIRDIDRLEKSDVEAKVYREFYDRFQIFLIVAMALFFGEAILRSVFFRKIP